MLLGKKPQEPHKVAPQASATLSPIYIYHNGICMAQHLLTFARLNRLSLLTTKTYSHLQRPLKGFIPCAPKASIVVVANGTTESVPNCGSNTAHHGFQPPLKRNCLSHY